MADNKDKAPTYPTAHEMPVNAVSNPSEEVNVLQERIDLALKTFEGGLWDWDLVHNKAFFSPQWKRMLHYPETAPLGTEPDFWSHLIHPEDATSIEAAMKRAFVPGGPEIDVVLRMRGGDGDYRWVRIRGQVLRDSHDNPLRLVGAIYDVTEARGEHVALLRAKEFSEKLVNSSTSGILAFDRDCELTAVNPAIEQLWGVKRDEVLGKSVFTCFPFLRETHEDCCFYDTLAGKMQLSVDRPFKHNLSRREGQYQAQYVPLTQDDGSVTGGLVFVTETTVARTLALQQKLLVDASITLAQSMNLATLLSQAARLAVPLLCDWCVVVLDDPKDEGGPQPTAHMHVAAAHSDGAMQDVLEALLEGPSRTFKDFLASKSPHKPLMSEVVEQVPESLLGLMVQDPILRQKLMDLGFGAYVRVPLVARQHVFGTMTFVNGKRPLESYDVTSAELLAQRTASALDNATLFANAQEAQRVREDVLAMVSHDLKSPLQAISLKCDRTLRQRKRRPDDVPESSAKLAEAVHMYSDRMNRLIFTILEAARLEGGRFTLERSMCGLNQLLDDATVSLSPVAQEKKVALQCIALDKDLSLDVDRERLLQAITNILDRAIRISPSGSQVTLTPQWTHGRIELLVEDFGPPLSDSDCAELLKQTWQPSEPVLGRTDLGLFVAQQIISAHGGRLFVDPKEDPLTPGATPLKLHLPAAH